MMRLHASTFRFHRRRRERAAGFAGLCRERRDAMTAASGVCFRAFGMGNFRRTRESPMQGDLCA